MKAIKMPSERHDLLFDKPINRWDEALPLGNGLTGCLVWGDGAPLSLSLDRADLWDTRLVPEVLDSGFTYRNLIELVRKGDQEQISRRFNDFFSAYPNPTKLPAGRIELQGEQAADAMTCLLDLREARAEVKWSAGGGSYQFESFLHAVNGLGYIRLRGEQADVISFKLKPPAYSEPLTDEGYASLSSNLSIASLAYPCAEFGREEDMVWFHQPTNHGLAYAVVVAERRISERHVEWVYCVAANIEGDDWFEQAKSRVREAVKAGFDDALPMHTEWWERYWGQSALTLPEFEMEK